MRFNFVQRQVFWLNNAYFTIEFLIDPLEGASIKNGVVPKAHFKPRKLKDVLYFQAIICYVFAVSTEE